LTEFFDPAGSAHRGNYHFGTLVNPYGDWDKGPDGRINLSGESGNKNSGLAGVVVLGVLRVNLGQGKNISK